MTTQDHKAALLWTAGTLQCAVRMSNPLRLQDRITMEGEARTVDQILDAADKALDTTTLAVAHSSQQENDARDAAMRAEWMACETRRPWVVNSLRHRAEEMRAAEKRCRNAYRKDFMGKPAAYVADAFAEAAAAFESRLATMTAAQGDAAQGGGNG